MELRTTTDPNPNRLLTAGRRLAIPLLTALALSACANDGQDPSLSQTTPSALESVAPTTLTSLNTTETRYIPTETTTLNVPVEQTTGTTYHVDTIGSTSPESQSAGDYISSDERSVIVNDHLERLKGQFTELLEQHPDKVWFYNFTTGENSRGLKSSDDAGILELRFGDSKDTEKTIYAYVNANFEQDEHFEDRFAGYGVITGPEDDPLARREISRDQSPTGDMLSGPVYASYMDKADVPGSDEDAIRGSTYDFYDDPDATPNDVDNFDREIAAELFGIMQKYLILNSDETIRGEIVPAAPSPTR